MGKKNVVLLNGETVQALAMAHALSDSGYSVTLICDSKESYGYNSRHADRRIVAPSIHDEPEEFHRFFINWIKNNKADAIIPMNDYSAEFLSRNKEQLQEFTSFIIPDYDVFIKGYDKNQLMKVCMEGGFPHPKTIDLTLENYKKCALEMCYPALIKPNITTGGRGFAKVNSPQELESRYPEIKAEYGDCHVQEFIPYGGAQYKVEVFIDNNGVVKGSTVMHKCRFYPENGGSSCCSISIVEPRLVEMCQKILKTIGWIGFADFDLIEDPRTGEIKVMEINPRVPACIRLSLVSGMDFATMIADASLGNNIKDYEYAPGKILRYMALDTLWFAYSHKRFHTSPSWWRLYGKNVFWQECGGGFKAMLRGTLAGLKKQLNPQFRQSKAGLR